MTLVNVRAAFEKAVTDQVNDNDPTIKMVYDNVPFKVPGKTGWLDTKAAFNPAIGVDETAGSESLVLKGCNNDPSFDAGIDSSSPYNDMSFGVVSMVLNEKFILRISTSNTWTGYLTDIDIEW